MKRQHIQRCISSTDFYLFSPNLLNPDKHNGQFFESMSTQNLEIESHGTICRNIFTFQTEN